jgi:chromosome segregation ATPase
VVDAPVAEAPAPSAPLVAEPAPDEARALRALLEASEAGRTEADARAAQATAQVQQAQQQLAQLELDAQSRVAAAETKARKAANDAQDWQIRHREAETTIAELAASVGSAEQRMSEIRAERDDLLAELEAATAPTPSQSPVTQV